MHPPKEKGERGRDGERKVKVGKDGKRRNGKGVEGWRKRECKIFN
jgi:hypothetical protein